MAWDGLRFPVKISTVEQLGYVGRTDNEKGVRRRIAEYMRRELYDIVGENELEEYYLNLLYENGLNKVIGIKIIDEMEDLIKNGYIQYRVEVNENLNKLMVIEKSTLNEKLSESDLLNLLHMTTGEIHSLSSYFLNLLNSKRLSDNVGPKIIKILENSINKGLITSSTELDEKLDSLLEKSRVDAEKARNALKNKGKDVKAPKLRRKIKIKKIEENVENSQPEIKPYVDEDILLNILNKKLGSEYISNEFAINLKNNKIPNENGQEIKEDLINYIKSGTIQSEEEIDEKLEELIQEMSIRLKNQRQLTNYLYSKVGNKNINSSFLNNLKENNLDFDYGEKIKNKLLELIKMGRILTYEDIDLHIEYFIKLYSDEVLNTIGSDSRLEFKVEEAFSSNITNDEVLSAEIQDLNVSSNDSFETAPIKNSNSTNEENIDEEFKIDFDIVEEELLYEEDYDLYLEKDNQKESKFYNQLASSEKICWDKYKSLTYNCEINYAILARIINDESQLVFDSNDLIILKEITRKYIEFDKSSNRKKMRKGQSTLFDF